MTPARAYATTTALPPARTRAYAGAHAPAYTRTHAPEAPGGPGAARFGFNGKEDDGSWGGSLISDYGMRLSAPAIGRFLSVDPLTSDYPWYSPYQFAGNKPIWARDVDGMEEDVMTIDRSAGGEPAISVVFDAEAERLAGNYIHTVTLQPSGAVEYGSTNDMSIAAVRAKAERNARLADQAENGVSLWQALGNAAGFWTSAVADRMAGGGTDMREFQGDGAAVLDGSFREIADAEIQTMIWSSQAALAYFTGGASLKGTFALSTLGRTALINGGTDFASQAYFADGNIGDVNLFGVAASTVFANPFAGSMVGNAAEFTIDGGFDTNFGDRASALSGLAGGFAGQVAGRFNFDSILRPGASQTGLDLTVSGTFTSQAQLATGMATSEEPE